MLETGYPAHVVELLVKLYRKQQARAGVIYNWLRVKKVFDKVVFFHIIYSITNIQYIIRNGHERNTRRISRWITDWWSKDIKLKICRRYHINSYTYIRTGIASTG